MTTISEIRSVEWQPKLGEIGAVVEGIEDVNQCIRIILMTPKGSDPHRPEFGSDVWKYIDAPVKIAIPNIIRETIDAIRKWETRIDVKTVKAEIQESTVLIKVEWVFKGSRERRITEVSV